MDLRDIVFYMHLGALAGAACGVVAADMLAMSWLRGIKDELQSHHLQRTHTLVSAALILLILSGSYLFWPMRAYLLHQPLFYVKMAFVLALILNSFVIGKFMHVAAKRPFRALTSKEKTPLFISGIVSGISWAGAGVAALLLFGW